MQKYIFLIKIEYHTKLHDIRYKHNNYSVVFTHENEICFGNIKRIIQNKSAIFFLINKLNTSKLDIEFNYTNEELLEALKLFHNFYLEVHESEQLVIINAKPILSKCILMNVENILVETPCM